MCRGVYSLMVEERLIAQRKHFVPDLELCELMLFTWLRYFALHYRDASPPRLFRELFASAQSQCMGDLLEYALAMNIFDEATSHPLLFHLALLAKLMPLVRYGDGKGEEEEEHGDAVEAKRRELVALWEGSKAQSDLDSAEYHAPVEQSMTAMLERLSAHAVIGDASLLDEVVGRLQSTWSPLFAVFVREKRERQTAKRRQRWREMVEPQLMGILSPKQLRFIDDAASANADTFEPLMVHTWFDSGTATPPQRPQKEQQERPSQSSFEAFVASLDVAYLCHLVSYDKLLRAQGLWGSVSVDAYMANLNADGVYVDPGVQSFVTSIEPLVASLRPRGREQQQAQGEGEAVEQAQAQRFVAELEGMYAQLVAQQQQQAQEAAAQREEAEARPWRRVDAQLREAFLAHMGHLLRDQPKLQSFVDAIQEVIDDNPMLRGRRRMYSLGDARRSRVEDAVHGAYRDWHDFALNVEGEGGRSKRSEVKRKQTRRHVQFLSEFDEEDELSRLKVNKFLRSVEKLPMKANMTPETYALAKMVQEIDELY